MTATKSHSPVTDQASVTPSTSASRPPSTGSASRSARIRMTACVTPGNLAREGGGHGPERVLPVGARGEERLRRVEARLVEVLLLGVREVELQRGHSTRGYRDRAVGELLQLEL